MNFVWPAFLLLLPLAVWVFYRRTKRCSVPVPSLRLWSGAESGRGRYLFLLPLLFALGSALLVIALARPQAGTEQNVQIKEGIAIEMLVDVSSSMEMGMTSLDDRPAQTRIEVAKELVVKFILGDGEDLQGRTSDLIGLITFARYADTRSPLTTGHEALAQIVENLTVQDRPNEDGTAYGDALALAAARLRHLEELKADSSKKLTQDVASKIIILLTDGENNSGTHLPVEAGGLAKAWGIKVYAISLAEAEDESLSDAERVLEHISLETGGIFRKARDYESLKSVYHEIDQLERTKIATRQLDRVAEWFWLPLTLGLLCWLAALILEATRLRTTP